MTRLPEVFFVNTPHNDFVTDDMIYLLVKRVGKPLMKGDLIVHTSKTTMLSTKLHGYGEFLCSTIFIPLKATVGIENPLAWYKNIVDYVATRPAHLSGAAVMEVIPQHTPLSRKSTWHSVWIDLRTVNKDVVAVCPIEECRIVFAHLSATERECITEYVERVLTPNYEIGCITPVAITSIATWAKTQFHVVCWSYSLRSDERKSWNRDHNAPIGLFNEYYITCFTGTKTHLQQIATKVTQYYNGSAVFWSRVDETLDSKKGDFKYIDVYCKFKRPHYHNWLVAVTVIFSQMEIPPYVILEIIDWLPGIAQWSRRDKVTLMEATRDCRNRVLAQRVSKKHCTLET